ncbi:MAG: family 10 glycosylhydrolase [Spirosomataceae bacterium]
MRFFTLLTIFSCFKFAFAQNPPKREFRGAWIATVSNIDFPSSKFLSSEQQKAEFVNILNKHQQAGINAVVVQLRTNGDALYPSELEPWAEWLTGKQGQAPSPFYDPLALMIEECRKRGLEFHAWLNPYRAVSNINTSQIADNHIAKKRPDLLLAYGNLRILDPGNPESREWVTKVVMDIVRRYDVDGIHFDDYFYPYPVSGQVLNDDATFSKFNRGFTNRADWRRENVDLLIKMVSDSIKAAKPYVKFGISPFGIWQNKSASQPLGSETRGLESYNDIFANSIKWSQQGWVDYMAPQLYWYIGYSVADYDKLTKWWASNANNRHLYIGQAIYRVNADVNWNSGEIPKQIRLNRNTLGVNGSIFYNTTFLNQNPLGVRDSVINNYFKFPALPPTMPWKKSTMPNPPTGLIATLSSKEIQLKWNKAQSGINEIDKIKRYVVYRFANDEKVDLSNAKAIRHITNSDENSFTDTEINAALKYTYVVTALDRLHNESTPSNEASVQVITEIEEETEIAETELFQNFPNPFNNKTYITYFLSKGSWVKLRIFDILGVEKQLLVDEWQSVGLQSIEFNNKILPRGVYIYSIETSDIMLTKRMVIE